MSDYADLFDRPDSTDISAGAPFSYTLYGGGASLNISGNTITTSDVADTDCMASPNVDLNTNDHYGKLAIQNLTISGVLDVGCNIELRHAVAANTNYTFAFGTGLGISTGAVEVFKVVAGVFTSLSTAVGQTAANGDVLSSRAQSSLLTLLWNNVVLIQVTDTAITSGTRAGLDIFRSNTLVTISVDNFTFGDLVDQPYIIRVPPGKIAPGSQFGIMPPIADFPVSGAYVGQAIALAGIGTNANAGTGDLTSTMSLAGTGANAESGGTSLLKATMAMVGAGANADSGTGSINATMALSGAGANANSGAGLLLRFAVLAGHGDNSNAGSALLLLTAALLGHGDNANSGAGLMLLRAALAGAGTNANAGSGDLVGAVAPVTTATYYRLGEHRAIAPRSHGIRD